MDQSSMKMERQTFFRHKSVYLLDKFLNKSCLVSVSIFVVIRQLLMVMRSTVTMIDDRWHRETVISWLPCFVAPSHRWLPSCPQPPAYAAFPSRCLSPSSTTYHVICRYWESKNKRRSYVCVGHRWWWIPLRDWLETKPFCLKMDILLYFIGMVSRSVSSKLKVEIESKI